MRLRERFLISTILFAVPPASSAWAQELSVDAKSLDKSATSARSAGAKGVMTREAKKEKGINASRPANLSPGKEPTEFSWSGSYGGAHAGEAFGSTDRNER